MTIGKHKKIFVWCMVILLSLIFTYSIDSRLVSKDKRPIFVIPGSVMKDGGTREYYGLGYKVIGWRRLTIVKQNDGKEVDGRMVGYEMSTLFNPKDINQGPKKELKFVPNK